MQTLLLYSKGLETACVAISLILVIIITIKFIKEKKLSRGDLVLYNDPESEKPEERSHITWVSQVFGKTAIILLNGTTRVVLHKNLTKLPPNTFFSVSTPRKEVVFVGGLKR
jgi:hypothetical protein